MKKKLGPLQTYQWLAIGLAAGVLYYIYKARQAAAAAAASTGGSPAQASDTTSLGPVDPTTGQPYALEALGGGSNNTAAQNSGPTSLAQELSDLGSIETLLAGISQISPSTGQTTTGTAGSQAISSFTGQAASDITQIRKTELTLSKQLAAVTKQVDKAKKAVSKATADAKPTSNPGHTVTYHPDGKQTASSSAPHSSQQHKNVAPPTHQKHPTRTGGAGY